MKKGLFTVMALLAVFAIMGCDTDSNSGNGPNTNGNDAAGFVPPEDWIGFTEEEMLAAKFNAPGVDPAGIGIDKDDDGFYTVTLKSVTSTGSKASLVWVNFKETGGEPRAVFKYGWYASLSLPTTGVRPVNVHVLALPKGQEASGNGSWPASQNAVLTGDLPATMDDLYVVGDLSMHWGTDEIDQIFTGLVIWFEWAPGDEEGVEYTFTIKDLKVFPYN